jgi:hypothetical protein
VVTIVLKVAPSNAGIRAKVEKILLLINDFNRRASSLYFDDLEGLELESLEANVNSLYMLGPIMKGLLLNI